MTPPHLSPVRIIAPEEGSTAGGTPFSIYGPNITSSLHNDAFDGTTINLAKWQTLTTNSGSVSQRNTLRARSGATTGSQAGLILQANLTDFDVRVSFTIHNELAAFKPDGTIMLAALEAQDPAASFPITYGRLSIQYDPLATRLFARAETFSSSGTVFAEQDLSSASKSGTIRIVKAGSRVTLLLNNSVVLDDKNLLAYNLASASIRFYVDNLSSTYGIATDFSNFLVSTLALFGNEPCLSLTQAGDIKLDGVAPPNASGTVAVTLYVDGTVQTSLVNDFNYVFPNELVLTDNGALNLVDEDLRNPINSRKGFF